VQGNCQTARFRGLHKSFVLLEFLSPFAEMVRMLVKDFDE
jgi:hypothetical protein